MSQDQPPYHGQPNQQSKPPFARIFTTIRNPDGTAGQYFDVPLILPQVAMPGAVVDPVKIAWIGFMTNFLQHRGILLDNFWISERVVDFIQVNPDGDKAFDPGKNYVGGNVVPLRPGA